MLCISTRLGPNSTTIYVYGVVIHICYCILAGRLQKPASTPSSPHVPSPKKTSIFSKKPLALPAVSEVKDPSTRTRSTHAAAPIVEKQAPKGPVYTVRDMLQGKVPSSIRRDSVGQGPTLTRSKSAFSAPGLPRVAGAGPMRVIQPVAPLTTEPPAVAAQPTGLRKPSPKLGFFDSVCSHCQQLSLCCIKRGDPKSSQLCHLKFLMPEF